MASDLRMDVQPYGDGRVLLTIGGLSMTLEPSARDELRELLDRAAMPGQVTARVWPCCKCCQLEQEMAGAGPCVPPHHLQPCAGGCDA